MKKTQRFFALILCVIMLLPILGCGQNKPQPSQTVQESAPAPESSKPSGPVYDTEPPIMENKLENSEPISEETKPIEPYCKPYLLLLEPLGKEVSLSDLTQTVPIKHFHADMNLREYEQYRNDNYYYIVFNDTKSEIYHIAVNSEPRLLYSTEDQIEHIAASDKDVFFTTENTFYSVPVEGGEAKELCACENITFIDVINSDTVFLVDSRSKGWDMNFGLAERNDNGDWDIIPYDWETSRYYYYSVSDNTLEEWTRETYLNELINKEYFGEDRFRVYGSHIFEGEITGKDYVIVFDRLTGAYAIFENIKFTANVMHLDIPYFARNNEILMLTPYEEKVLCKAEGNIDAFCFDNNRNIYFVSEENLYFANDNKGNNTLVDYVGKVTTMGFSFNLGIREWTVSAKKTGYDDNILSCAETYTKKRTSKMPTSTIWFNTETGERYE